MKKGNAKFALPVGWILGKRHRASRDPLRPVGQERPQTGDVQPENKKRALTRPFHSVHKKQPIPQMLNRLRKPTKNETPH